MKPGIALCMIVRNEQSVLGKCLESAAKAVDAIYITDTGSDDRTVEIARNHGANVRIHPWTDDFSEARNHSILGVEEEWILILDADDFLPGDSAGILRERVLASDATALTVNYETSPDHSPALTRRLFRNHRGIRFDGIIHESIRPSLKSVPGARTGHTGVLLKHTGFRADNAAAKLQRNLPLLRREWDRCRESGDSFQQLHVAKELAYHLWQLGGSEDGDSLLLHALEAWRGHESKGEETGIEAFAALLWRYHETGRLPLARELCLKFERDFQSSPEFALYRGITSVCCGGFETGLEDLNRFEEAWTAGRIKTSVPLSYTNVRLWDLQGQCLMQQGAAREASALFEKCIRFGGDRTEFTAKLHLANSMKCP